MTVSRIAELPEEIAQAMKAAGVWTPECPVPLARLAYLSSIRYVDFANIDHSDGELVVLDVVAPYVADIFNELYARRFPLAQMRSMHHFHASDELSMAANNTTCFCHRPIEGSTMPSMHSYGLAIDINPLQNPFITFEPGMENHPVVQPKESWQFINRHNGKPGMVEEVVPVMSKHGFFRWGGRWTTPIDYHHFEMPRSIGEILIAMKTADGQRFLNELINHPVVSKSNFVLAENSFDPLCERYKQEPMRFFDELPIFLQSLP